MIELSGVDAWGMLVEFLLIGFLVGYIWNNRKKLAKLEKK